VSTRAVSGTWVFLVRLVGSWSLGFAVLGVRSSWGSHAHPLVSCFVSLVLFVSLFVISLVVVFVSIIVIMSLRTVQCR
jgi:hypothetical protein